MLQVSYQRQRLPVDLRSDLWRRLWLGPGVYRSCTKNCPENGGLINSQNNLRVGIDRHHWEVFMRTPIAVISGIVSAGVLLAGIASASAAPISAPVTALTTLLDPTTTANGNNGAEVIFIGRDARSHRRRGFRRTHRRRHPHRRRVRRQANFWKCKRLQRREPRIRCRL